MTTICIIENGTGYDLVHVSVGANTAYMRTWPEGACQWEREAVTPNDAEGSINTALRAFTNREACLLALPEIVNDPNFRRQGLPVANARWGEVFRNLRKKLGGDDPNQIFNPGEVVPPLGPIGEVVPAPRIVIPLTKLRKFYSPTLRSMLNESSFRKLLCEQPTNMGRCLDEWFRRAFKQFSVYENLDDHFRPEVTLIERAKNILKYKDKPDAFAKCLQARLINDCINGINTKISCNGAQNPAIKFSFIDFEISPYRTTGNAIFADGRSGVSCGQGGLDLLLISEDGFPGVGEIKAQTDTDIFLALVQALVYATELTTPNQLKRLKNAYPKDNDEDKKHFNDVTETSKCDIYIIYQEPIAQDGDPKLLKETLAIANSLFDNSDSAVRQHVRRIAFISAKLSAEGGVEFLCKPQHIFPSHK